MAETTPVQSPAPFSAWLGVVLLFALFGAIVLAIVGPAPRGNTYEKMRAENRVKKLKDARDEDVTQVLVDGNDGVDRRDLPSQPIGDVPSFKRSPEQCFEPTP